MFCIVCGSRFNKTTWNKKFCSYVCQNKATSLRYCKETFKLSAVDAAIRDKLLGGKNGII